jgi:carbon storage regulator
VLIIGRRHGERLFLESGGLRITVTVLSGRSGQVRLGIDAPAEVRVFREEVAERMRAEAELRATDPPPP